MNQRKVIIIEDDQILSAQLRSMLELEDFDVQSFPSAEEFLYSKEPRISLPTVYLLDLNLPGLRGTELIRVIRHRDKLSMIFMITGATSNEAFEDAFRLGADDFLAKPFHPEHLLLKVRNAHHRLVAVESSVMGLGMKLMPEGRVLAYNGKKLRLTDREFSIIQKLISSPEEIHTRASLIQGLGAVGITERTIDVHVSNLRKKLATINLQIETYRNKGYRLGTLDPLPRAV